MFRFFIFENKRVENVNVLLSSQNCVRRARRIEKSENQVLIRYTVLLFEKWWF